MDFRSLLWISTACALAPSLAGAQVTVDNAGTARDGKVGGWSSIVSQGGETAISYFCEGDTQPLPYGDHYALRFAWKNGASAWQWTTISTNGGGNDSSMARGSDGQYNIAWASWSGVMWARGSGTSWTINPNRADNDLSQPSRISIAVDGLNRPHIAYMEAAPESNYALHYTVWNGTTWQRGETDIVATGIWTGAISNRFLALDSAGAPHISYISPPPGGFQGGVMYASIQGGSWSAEPLPVVGIDTSLVIAADDSPHVAISTTTGLMYGHKTGGAWTFENIVEDPYPSSICLALSDSGVPFVSYRSGNDIHVAKKDAAGWIISEQDYGMPTVANFILGALGTSIDVDETGLAHVSYDAIESLNSTGLFRQDLRTVSTDGTSNGDGCAAIAAQPQSISRCPDDAATFMVEASGGAPLSFQWQVWFYDDPVWTSLSEGQNEDPSANQFTAQGVAGPMLTIAGFSEEPEQPLSPLVPMSVRCIVTNGCGSATSEGAVLTVNCCPADFDGNGLGEVSDIFAFLSAWFSLNTRADIDGVPGIAVPDIFAFLSLWFAGC